MVGKRIYSYLIERQTVRGGTTLDENDYVICRPWLI